MSTYYDDDLTPHDDGIEPGERMEAARNPARHCFREDSPTIACRDCGELASEHSGCDCAPADHAIAIAETRALIHRVERSWKLSKRGAQRFIYEFDSRERSIIIATLTERAECLARVGENRARATRTGWRASTEGEP